MAEKQTQNGKPLSEVVPWKWRNRIALAIIGFGMVLLTGIGFFNAPTDLIWPATWLISGTAGVYFVGSSYEAVKK